ncbi:MAG: dephospho-CoA kinase [Muribaculaceae bacterium]|nr:dephospho-CoA kinase [Muribaculaceae bacterium]
MITKVCVTGGIGSGKSVICRICALKGIPVYDCDSHAKELMQTDPELRAFIIDCIGVKAFDQDGILNRPLLAEKIFGNAEVRSQIEREVHAAVRRDILQWADIQEESSDIVIIETAIPSKSFIDKLADKIWVVDAPVETRIQRVATRSGLSHRQILDRIAAQNCEFDNLPSHKTSHIDNSGSTPLLPQIDTLLNQK